MTFSYFVLRNTLSTWRSCRVLLLQWKDRIRNKCSLGESCDHLWCQTGPTSHTLSPKQGQWMLKRHWTEASKCWDSKLHRVADFFRGLDTFPATLRLLRDLHCGEWKDCLKGIGCIWGVLHVRYLHPLKAALPKSTVARFSRLFDQQACLYIHKLTPPDLRSPALAYLLRIRNLRHSFWWALELGVARAVWITWLMKVRGKLEDELLYAL